MSTTSGLVHMHFRIDCLSTSRLPSFYGGDKSQGRIVCYPIAVALQITIWTRKHVRPSLQLVKLKYILPILTVPCTLRTPLEPNVCYSRTFGNNFRTKRKFTKYLMESCSLASDKHF